MKIRKVIVGVATGVLLAASVAGVASAATYVQRSNALIQYGSLRLVNNHNVHFVKANGNYSWSKNPSGRDTIKSTSGTKWTLRTKYLLPTTHAVFGKSAFDVTNPQAAAFGGKYLFVLYAPHNTVGKGFVVRYSSAAFAKMGSIQSALDSKKGSSGIKVGPQIDVGHGQSLAYNRKQHSLWMWRDRPDMKPTASSTIQRISMSSLRPNRAIKFHMNNRGAMVPAGHNLTFDNSGHAYWWGISGGHVKIYRGVLGAKSIRVSLVKQLLKNQTGTHQQSMGYNPHNGRLYLVSDDSIQTLPASKTYGHGSLKPSDIKYTRFHSGREFESMIFDKSGHAMLLTNRNPELLRSTTRY